MIKRILKSMLFISLISFDLANACWSANEVIEFTSRDKEIVVPTRLAPLSLFRDRDGFHVVSENGIADVENYFCDRMLLEMSDEQLKNFVGKDKPKMVVMTTEEFDRIASNCVINIIEITDEEKEKLIRQLFSRGYIAVNQTNDGKFVLRAQTCGLGGVKEEGVGKILKDGASLAAQIPLMVGSLGSLTLAGSTTAIVVVSGEASIGVGAAAILSASAVGGIGFAILALPVGVFAGFGYVGYKLFGKFIGTATPPAEQLPTAPAPQPTPTATTEFDTNAVLDAVAGLAANGTSGMSKKTPEVIKIPESYLRSDNSR